MNDGKESDYSSCNNVCSFTNNINDCSNTTGTSIVQYSAFNPTVMTFVWLLWNGFVKLKSGLVFLFSPHIRNVQLQNNLNIAHEVTESAILNEIVQVATVLCKLQIHISNLWFFSKDNQLYYASLWVQLSNELICALHSNEQI